MVFVGSYTHSTTQLKVKLKSIAFICTQPTRPKIWKIHYCSHSEYILFVFLGWADMI